MTKRSSLISFIIPVHNEDANLAWHHEKVDSYMTKNSINAEIIYVNDGSTDGSLNILRELANTYTNVRYLSFSRNFGKEAATSAGLNECRGDAAIMLDADGQHPIELVGEFIKRWHDGMEVVIGVRDANTDEGLIKRYGSKIFYKILNTFTDGNTVPGSTDFRLIDRKVIDEFNKLSERNRITRGLIDWLGFRRDYVHFTSPARHGGVAAYSVSKLIRLAIHALVSQTTKPLQITGILGGGVVIISALLAVFLAVETYVFHDPMHLAITGSAILALFVSFLVGIVLICQWLLALYIESIHSEAQNRPLYIIGEKSKSNE